MKSRIDLHAENVRGMAALVAVADAGSFSNAAKALELTPSALSKLISRLETDLKIRLLERTTRRVQLTEIGVGYLERARRLLNELSELRREAESKDPTPKGSLRITAPTLLGQVRVLPVVLAFQNTYPDVKVHFELADRFVDVIEERFDVAVRMTSNPPESLAARKLDDDHRVLCASPDYFKRRGKPKHPSELASHECITLLGERPTSGFRLRTHPRRPQLATFGAKGRLALNSVLAIHQAALAGFGLADLPRYLIGEDLRQGRLVEILEKFVPTERTIFAAYAPSAFVPTKTRAFIQALVVGFAAHQSGAATTTTPRKYAAEKVSGPTSRD